MNIRINKTTNENAKDCCFLNSTDIYMNYQKYRFTRIRRKEHGIVFVLDFQLNRKFESGDTWREAVTRAQRVLNNGYFTNSLIGTASLTRKPPLHGLC